MDFILSGGKPIKGKANESQTKNILMRIYGMNSYLQTGR